MRKKKLGPQGQLYLNKLNELLDLQDRGLTCTPEGSQLKLELLALWNRLSKTDMAAVQAQDSWKEADRRWLDRLWLKRQTI